MPGTGRPREVSGSGRPRSSSTRVGGELRAAVVVDDDLLDDQGRRLVVVRDRAGRAAAGRDDEARAVVIRRAVPRDRAARSRCRSRAFTVRLFCPSPRKGCAEPPFTWNEKFCACFVPPLSLTTTFLTTERRRLVVVRDRAGGRLGESQRDRGCRSGCRCRRTTNCPPRSRAPPSRTAHMCRPRTTEPLETPPGAGDRRRAGSR